MYPCAPALRLEVVPKSRRVPPSTVPPLRLFQTEVALTQFNLPVRGSIVMDLLMGLFRGAVFHHGWVARKQPIKQPTEMPTSTMALMGRFPSLMGRFPTLMGRSPISS